MKRKLFKCMGVGLALVLMLSMLPFAGLVGAAGNYAGYTLIEADDGAADWSTAQANSGTYSVMLKSGTDDGTNVGRIEVIVDPIPIADFTGATFFVYEPTGSEYGGAYPNADEIWPWGTPYINILIDLDGDGLMTGTEGTGWDRLEGVGSITVGSTPSPTSHPIPTLDTWVQMEEGYGFFDSNDSMTAGLGQGPKAGIPGGTGVAIVSSLADWKTMLEADYSDAQVVGIQITFGYWGAGVSQTIDVYADDATINGVTYDLEPIALDAAGYGAGDTVSVMVLNGNDNADPVRIDEVEVDVISGSDLVGLTLTLTETGVNTGVFEFSFPTTGTTPPGTGELLVSDGDTITATYTNGDWGTGVVGVVEVTASVDDTAPVFVSVLDGDDHYKNTDTISLTADVGEDGLTVTADFSNIDSEYTAGDETVVPGGSGEYDITYPVSADNTMADGEYTIPVTAEDDAGNTTTDTSFTTTLDNTAPAVTDPTADPAVIQPDDPTLVIFTASVTDDGSGVDSVTIDLSTIGGTSSVDMLDGGDAPDVTVDDGIYTASLTTDVAAGTYTLTITATDGIGNEATSEITLPVIADSDDPVIVSTAVEYSVGAVSARTGDPVVFTAVVTDSLSGVDTVTVDATDIGQGATEDLLLTDPDTYISGSLTVTVAVGTYTLIITATDYAGNTDTANVTVEVAAVLTGYDIAL